MPSSDSASQPIRVRLPENLHIQADVADKVWSSSHKATHASGGRSSSAAAKFNGLGSDESGLTVEVAAPSDEVLKMVLRQIVTRLMKLLTWRSVLLEEPGEIYWPTMAATRARPVRRSACGPAPVLAESLSVRAPARKC